MRRLDTSCGRALTPLADGPGAELLRDAGQQELSTKEDGHGHKLRVARGHGEDNRRDHFEEGDGAFYNLIIQIEEEMDIDNGSLSDTHRMWAVPATESEAISHAQP